jgi:hypothetical protein
MEIHGPGAHPSADRIVLDGDEVGERGVVHEHVDRAVRRARRPYQLLAFLGPRDIDGDGRRLAAGRADVRDRLLERAFEGMFALVLRAGGAYDPAALRREDSRDLRTDTTAAAGDDHHLAIELAHAWPPVNAVPGVNPAAGRAPAWR